CRVLGEEVLVKLPHLAMARQSIAPSILRASIFPCSTSPVRSSWKLFLFCPTSSLATSSPVAMIRLCLCNNYSWTGWTSPYHLTTNQPCYSADSPLNSQLLFPM